MKTIKMLLPFLAISILFFSCEKEQKNPQIENETEQFKQVTSLTLEDYKVDIFTDRGKLQTGYNQIYLQVRSANGTLEENAELSWLPIMDMHGMSHACPYSIITKKEGTKSVYEGYVIFTMPSGDMGHWMLQLNLKIEGKTHTINEMIQVDDTGLKTVNSFTGTDEQRYVIALIQPQNPKVAINDMIAGLFKMESMMSFSIVDNYKIRIDPRMPSMGNHGSPNNEDLTQDTDGLYHGKLSLSMTGFWNINIQVENENGVLLKGESVSEEREKSSLSFEIEF